MYPVETKKAVKIVKKFDNNAWGIAYFRELLETLTIIILSYIPSLQPAIFLATYNASHLDRGLVVDKVDHFPPPDKDRAEIVGSVDAARAKASEGLSSFQILPPNLSSIEVFDHIISFWHRAYAPKQDEHKPYAYLACSPCTKHQKLIMDVGCGDKVMGILMSDVNESGCSLQ